MTRKKDRDWQPFVLLAILLLAIVFRFYKIDEWFQFSFDEEVWGYRIYRVIAFQDWKLIGNEISSTKLFTGPAYIYFHVPFLVLSKLNPLIGGYLWSGIGVVTAILVYFFTKTQFSKRVAVLASLLYSSSFAMGLYDRRYWNVTPVPVASLLGIWWFLEGLKGKKRAFIWSALILTFGLHSHFSTMVVVIALGAGFWWWRKTTQATTRKTLSRRFLIAGLIFIGLNTFPQIVFDLRHDWWHVKAAKSLVQSFSQPKKTDSNANAKGILTQFSQAMGSLVYLGEKIDVADEMSHCKEIVTARPKSPTSFQIIGLAIVVGMVIYSLTHRHKPLSKIWLVMIVANFLGLFIYRERVYAYHFAPLMPFLFIFGGLILDKIGQKMGYLSVGVLVVGFVLINTNSLLTAGSEMSYVTKKQIVEAIASEVGDESIQVDVLGSCERYGMRYLFTALGKPVAKSWVDSDLGYLYPEEMGDEVDTIVTIAVEDEGAGEDFFGDVNRLDVEADKKIEVGKARIYFEKNR